MLVKVLKEDVTVDFRHYGLITVPKGTMTDHKTATGDDPAYNFVCEFDWIDRFYPEIANVLKMDVDSFGINVPEDMLMQALRVKFLYDDSGNCRDIFRNYYATQRYCRMMTGSDTLVQWCSVTDDYDEPDCPLRTDIFIQVVDPGGKAIVAEQQSVINGEFRAEKLFPFSWERIPGEAASTAGQVYRKQMLRYIIDSKKGFKGHVENTIGEDGIVHYTNFLNFEEYKKEKERQ